MNESILDENTRVGTLLFCTINTEAENSVCKTSNFEHVGMFLFWFGSCRDVVVSQTDTCLKHDKKWRLDFFRRKSAKAHKAHKARTLRRDEKYMYPYLSILYDFQLTRI
jgi:hypothetical protein